MATKPISIVEVSGQSLLRGVDDRSDCSACVTFYHALKPSLEDDFHHRVHRIDRYQIKEELQAVPTTLKVFGRRHSNKDN